MEYKFESVIFEEYRSLRDELSNDKNIVELISKRNSLNEELRNMDCYLDKYKQLKESYDITSNMLNDNIKYKRFKILERELNLFVMHCNKELSKLFDLDKKECQK